MLSLLAALFFITSLHAEERPLSIRLAEEATSEEQSIALTKAVQLTTTRYDLPHLEMRIEEQLRAAISEKGAIDPALRSTENDAHLPALLISLYDKTGDKRYRRAVEKLYNELLATFAAQPDRYRLAPFYAQYARRFGKRKTGDIRKEAYTAAAASFVEHRAALQTKAAADYVDALLATLEYIPKNEAGHNTLLKLLPEALAALDSHTVEGVRLQLTAVRYKLLHPDQNRDRLLAAYRALEPTLTSSPDRAEAMQLALEVEALTNIELRESTEGRLLAFPGAEGGGRYTTGGRGGKTLLVTKLTDDGSEGTLRWAISQNYPRTVLFAVAGTIELEKPLKIAYGDLTLAGQSAPGEGITLRNHGVEINASNVIVRYLRFRPGNTSGKECDAFGGKGARDVIIDHCSMSWSSDECSSFYAMRNFTMQWCIISESLARSIHAKGAHGYGGIWGGRNASFHHNLVAHHTSRNPRLDHPFVYSAEQMLTHRGTVEVTNNLIYNWGDKACYGGEWGWWNFVGNYYKAGPACDSDEGEFIEASVNKKTGHGTGRYFLTGNILTASKTSTRDNRLGMKNKGDHPAEELYSEHPFAMARGAIEIEKAERAYKRILQEAGASYRRDAIDSRIVEEVTHGTTHGVGSKSGIKGLIDSQEDVGGWLTIAPEKAPLDTDGDGMPDSWEKSHNLNPNDATDGALIAGQSGYTHLEIYLNGLLRQSK